MREAPADDVAARATERGVEEAGAEGGIDVASVGAGDRVAGSLESGKLGPSDGDLSVEGHESGICGPSSITVGHPRPRV
jgi:hypothetical protein